MCCGPFIRGGNGTMSIILGIDIGGSTTKIVGLDSAGEPAAMCRVQAQDPITSLYGAMGNFLFTNGFQLADVSRIALTGVGASYVDGDIYGIPTDKVEEFTAVGAGGLALSRQERAVVVSMGTGPAFATEYAVQQSSLLSLLGALEAAGMLEQVEAIHLGDASELTMEYGGRFTVRLSYSADYARKLQKLQWSMDEGIIQDNMTGTFDMRGESKDYFRPDVR